MNEELLEWAKRFSCKTDSEAVDKLGELWGLKRKAGESDSELKDRIHVCMESCEEALQKRREEVFEHDFLKHLKDTTTRSMK